MFLLALFLIIQTKGQKYATLSVIINLHECTHVSEL